LTQKTKRIFSLKNKKNPIYLENRPTQFSFLLTF